MGEQVATAFTPEQMMRLVRAHVIKQWALVVLVLIGIVGASLFAWERWESIHVLKGFCRG